MVSLNAITTLAFPIINIPLLLIIRVYLFFISAAAYLITFPSSFISNSLTSLSHLSHQFTC